MARLIFQSFRFSYDWWRVQTLGQIGAIEGQRVLNSNEWESVKRQGDRAIQRWIDEQMKDRSCVVVWIGRATAGRRWVNYEMKKGWADGKGVVGVRIHRLKNSKGKQNTEGSNPLAAVTVQTRTGPRLLSSVAKTYDPPYTESAAVYRYIRLNIEEWIEEAIAIRKTN